MSRAAYRFVEEYVENVWVKSKNPYMSRAGWGHNTERTKQQHAHVACALQVVPLQVERDIAAFAGKLPERDMIDRVLELWRQAVATPADDGPRYVLADMLQSIDDPRGEFIALQLLERDPARVDLLVEQYQERWIGRHRDVLSAAQFTRGFLARIELLDTSTVTREKDPALATVEDLLPGDASSQRYAAYARAMPGLRRIEVWDEDSLEAFEETPSQLVHVGCHYPRLNLGNGLAELGARFLRACVRHPTLASLALLPTALEPIVRSPLLGRLAQITLVGRLRDTLPAWSMLHALRATGALTVAFAATPKLPSLLEPPPGELVLRGGGTLARVSGAWVRPDVVESLPATVKQLEVEGSSAALEQVARTRGIELVDVPAPVRAGIWRHT